MLRLKYLTWCVVFSLFYSHFSVYGDDFRTWTHKNGKNTLNAELIENKEGNIKLKVHDGRTVTIKESDLSRGDQNYLNYYLKVKEASANRKQAKSPPIVLPKGVTVEILSLSVRKNDPLQQSKTPTKGTQLKLLITSTQHPMETLDMEKSKLEWLTLPSGTLLESSRKTNISSEFSSDHKKMVITFFSPKIPDTGTNKFLLKGEIITKIEEE
ncbi:MAG: hypothetical protein LBQ54_05785 [Planctomycetaceae bacterium]|jgi:hypothetical protein|nr:hypothetical protein [Planctomycetaceae bacterium]